jgi:hypothetical protein
MKKENEMCKKNKKDVQKEKTCQKGMNKQDV